MSNLIFSFQKNVLSTVRLLFPSCFQVFSLKFFFFDSEDPLLSQTLDEGRKKESSWLDLLEYIFKEINNWILFCANNFSFDFLIAIFSFLFNFDKYYKLIVIIFKILLEIMFSLKMSNVETHFSFTKGLIMNIDQLIIDQSLEFFFCFLTFSRLRFMRFLKNDFLAKFQSLRFLSGTFYFAEVDVLSLYKMTWKGLKWNMIIWNCLKVFAFWFIFWR